MTAWSDPAHHEVGRAYAGRLRAALAPFSTPATSGYINMVDMAEGEPRSRVSKQLAAPHAAHSGACPRMCSQPLLRSLQSHPSCPSLSLLKQYFLLQSRP